jgi:hypothetical protein
MPEPRFSHPRVVPAAVATAPSPSSTAKVAPAPGGGSEVVAASVRQAPRLPRSQRELVAASLVRCPPRDGRLPGRLTR